MESEVGIGSTFHVRLPIAIAASQEQPFDSHPPRVAGNGPTILFIEDNQETSFVHESSLKTSNYRLIFAANIPEARAIMKTIDPIDLVALDRFMDGEDSLFTSRK